MLIRTTLDRRPKKPRKRPLQARSTVDWTNPDIAGEVDHHMLVSINALKMDLQELSGIANVPSQLKCFYLPAHCFFTRHTHVANQLPLHECFNASCKRGCQAQHHSIPCPNDHHYHHHHHHLLLLHHHHHHTTTNFSSAACAHQLKPRLSFYSLRTYIDLQGLAYPYPLSTQLPCRNEMRWRICSTLVAFLISHFT
ncbi:hypothetical protein IWX47DRAFT_269611 [Phyllosticta citricarpa]